MKLTYEQKISLYEDRQKGDSFSSLVIKYGINRTGCKYLCALIQRHGYGILRKDKNTYYSVEFKKNLLDMVLLEGKSRQSVSIEYGLKNIGLLATWVKEYKENGYTVIEKKRGRRTMANKPKKEKELTKLEQLEKENLYLRAENAYLKKLDALVRKEEAELKEKQK